MVVTTREEFKQYCLRILGYPVVEINVDDDQLEDRIDEALEYWRLYHNEGIEKIYLKHQVTASKLVFEDPLTEAFPYNSILTGETSGATATCVLQLNSTLAPNETFVKRVGAFLPGETVSCSGSSYTAVLGANPVVLGDYDKKYIELNDLVYGITRVVPLSGLNTSKSMFDIQYQLRLNDLYDLTSTSVIYYKMVMSHLALLDFELNSKPMFRFNRLQKRLYLDINWDSDIRLGDYIIVECYRALDPAEFNKVWSEPWLKQYTTALFKRQWAYSIKKFSGLQLPGGVTMDGQGLYDEAIGEIKELEQELIEKAGVLEFFLG